MRNYQKEQEWRKQRYDLIRAYIPKELGIQLRVKLKKENKSIANWISENIRKYLKID